LGGIVDIGHPEQVRREPAGFAPGGVPHLVLEVVAYAADEAEGTDTICRCRVTVRADV
jgi:topoisomerase-4 subunit B